MGLTGPVQPNDIVMRASEIGTTIPGIASLAMKSARKGAQRGVQGIYQLPSGNEPTPEFMNVSQQNLNNKTRQMADMLNMMAPEDEQLAYINEEEAGILKLLGGSGTTENNPAGIPSFYGSQGPGGAGAGGYGGSMSDSKGNSVGGGAGGGGGGGPNSARAAGVRAAQARAAAAASAAANAATAAAQRSNMADMAGGYDTPSGEKPGPGNPDRDTGADNVEDAQARAKDLTEKQKERNRDIVDAGATVTGAGTAMVDKEGGLIAAGGALRDFRQDREDKQIREAYYNKMLSEDFYDDNPAFTFDQRPALSSIAVNELGDPDFSSIDPSAYGTYEGKMQDRLGELTAKAKANNIDSTELNELAQLNEFYGKNPTTGMGFVESLEYQFTNPEFQADLKKAAPVLGAAALTAFAPMGLKGIFSIGQALMSFTDKTPKNLKDTMQKALDKLTGGEKKALAKSLPSTYRGFGIQGENRGEGADRKAEEEARLRREAEADTGTGEEDTRERDRFERAFANRYFVGPASLDEVRKYAVTGGGYNQLTPFYGREKETV